jgi:predicted oxidoreductase
VSDCSSFEIHDLKILISKAKIPPAVNQIQFDPHSYAEMTSLIEYCAQHSILIEGYTTLWPLRSDPQGPIARATLRIADKLKVEPEQVLLAWVRAKGCVAQQSLLIDIQLMSIVSLPFATIYLPGIGMIPSTRSTKFCMAWNS